MAPNTTQIAADAAADAGIKPIDVPSGRRPAGDNPQRAESRGIYEDANGERRLVGGGDVVPDGWSRVSDAPLEDRVGATPTAQDTAGQDTAALDDALADRDAEAARADAAEDRADAAEDRVAELEAQVAEAQKKAAAEAEAAAAKGKKS